MIFVSFPQGDSFLFRGSYFPLHGLHIVWEYLPANGPATFIHDKKK